FPERTVGSGTKKGQKITVDVPTHIAGVMDFSGGAIGTLATSFDVWAANVPRIEIYGTEGSLDVPDPNTFGGPVRVWQRETRQWRDVPVTRPYAQNSRGIGVADMAYAIRSGRPHRASGALGFHVLEAMHGFHDASSQDGHYKMSSTVERPAPLPAGLTPGTLDE
ncbi:MAG: gfo/Idh/MocA family oxidoreductase, partial [Armatimonadetes bacterium]|nr:gfo/Idh/MocA family oxidoreductase [Armatimonadota bacterium]